MSSLNDELPIGGELEAAVEIHASDTATSTRRVKVNNQKQNNDKTNNNKKKRKRSRRKKDEKMEAERSKRWKENAKAWQIELSNNNKVKIIKEQQNKSRKEKLDEEKMKWYGDEMILSKSWPDSTRENIIRIYRQNINGISRYTEYNEWEIILEELHNQQVDIACLTEINLDVNKSSLKYKLTEKAKHLDKNCSLITASSNTTITDSESKRGGSLILTRGNWSGREIEKGKDPLGRWTYSILSGKANRKLTIITLYRVCNQKNQEDGRCTIYMQQENDLINDNRTLTEPREAILCDLTSLITKLKVKGHDIILLGDMNGNVDTCDRVEKFLYDNELYDAIKTTHPGMGPATYDRGSRCIDLIAISNTIEPTAVKRCGYLPFYKGIFSDHRGMYVDLDITALFNKAKPDTTKEIYKRFTTSQVKKCAKYIDNLVIHVKEAAIDRKIDDLCERMNNFETNGEGNIDEMIHECKKLFSKTTQIMKASEKKVGKSHMTKDIHHQICCERLLLKLLQLGNIFDMKERRIIRILEKFNSLSHN